MHEYTTIEDYVRKENFKLFLKFINKNPDISLYTFDLIYSIYKTSPFILKMETRISNDDISKLNAIITNKRVINSYMRKKIRDRVVVVSIDVDTKTISAFYVKNVDGNIIKGEEHKQFLNIKETIRDKSRRYFTYDFGFYKVLKSTGEVNVAPIYSLLIDFFEK